MIKCLPGKRWVNSCEHLMSVRMLVLGIAKVFKDELVKADPAVVKVKGAFGASESFVIISDSGHTSLASKFCYTKMFQ